jgi:predicted anti-sigma-YlaC factor YlaD
VIDTPMRCVEFVELVTEWMESQLDDDVRGHIEEHLVVCAPCRAYVTQIRQSIRVMRDLDGGAPPPAVRDELVALLRTSRDG